MPTAMDIIRLKSDLSLSLRDIAKLCNCSKSTVSDVLERALKANIIWPIEISDNQLMTLLYPSVENMNAPSTPTIEKDISYDNASKLEQISEEVFPKADEPPDSFKTIYEHWLPYYGKEYMDQLVKHIENQSPALIEYWLPYGTREELQTLFSRVSTGENTFLWDFYTGGYIVKHPGQKIIQTNKLPPAEAISLGPWKLELGLCLIAKSPDYSVIFQTKEGDTYGY